MNVTIPGPTCRVDAAPGQSPDFLAIYEREEAVERAGTCPVCHVAYDEPYVPHDGRSIQVITGPDSWDAYGCPGCAPEEFVRDSESYEDDAASVQSMLNRAARDVAASERVAVR